MISKSVRRIISMALVLLMTCSSMLFAKGTDYLGHWAEGSIQNWIDKGYVKGYQDGTFKAENDITRAEFMAIVNRSLGFTAEKEVIYKDVRESHWAYNEFKRASAAGYIGGFEDGTLRPNNKITRQEVAAIIARLLNLKDAKGSKTFLNLNDVEKIPKWSEGVVSAIVDKGYMKLRGKDFAPTLPATRAEVIDALNRGYLNYIKIEYNKAGTYTAGVVDGSIEIKVKDVILEDTIINGNLIISEAVGSGNVNLKNVIVKGDTIVRGGGMNSIIIEDSDISNLIIEKIDGKIRILTKGSTYIDNVDMSSGGKLEADGNNFGYIVIAEDISSDEPIILIGNFENIEIRSGDNEIQVQSGTIKNLVIASTAKGAQVNLAVGAKVDEVEINAAAQIDGKGTIGTATVNTEGVKIIEPVEPVKKADGVGKVEIIKPTTSGGGGGGGSITPTNVPVSAITVTGTGDVTTITTDKGTLQMLADVTPTTATNKSVTWSVTDGTGSATISPTGLLTAVTNGTVTVKATSVSTGTVNGSLEIMITGQLLPSTIIFANGATVAKITSDANFTNAVSGVGDGAVTYTSGTPATATVNASTGEVTIVAVGTTVITAVKAATATHATVTKAYTLTVSKIPSTIVFANGTAVSKVTSDGNFTNTVSGVGDGAITYTSGTGTVATINATGEVTIKAVGTTVITAVKAATATHETVTNSYTLTVTAAPLQPSTLHFDNVGPINKVTNSSAFTNAASAMDGGDGAITYSSSDTSVAIVNAAGSITIKGAGTTIITATQAASSTHQAGTAMYTLNVTVGSLLASTLQFDFTLETLTKPLTQGAMTTKAWSTGGVIGAITHSSSNTSVATINPVTGGLTFLTKGTTIITATQEETSTHLGGTVSFTLVIN